MTGRARKLSGLMLIVPCCLLAGCGVGSSAVQGSSADTALEAGIGQQFQKLVPPGTAVQEVRCRPRHHEEECDIRMMNGRPDPVYPYVVFASRHVFHAFDTTVSPGDAWTPPGTFSGAY